MNFQISWKFQSYRGYKTSASPINFCTPKNNPCIQDSLQLHENDSYFQLHVIQQGTLYFGVYVPSSLQHHKYPKPLFLSRIVISFLSNGQCWMLYETFFRIHNLLFFGSQQISGPSEKLVAFVSLNGNCNQ